MSLHLGPVRTEDGHELSGFVTISDHHPIGSLGEQAFDVFGRADAAADLHRRGGVGEQVAHCRAVRSAARRRIEIDDVQSLETVSRPAPRDVTRITEADFFLFEVSADELHDAALAKINGRDGEHYEFEMRVRYS